MPAPKCYCPLCYTNKVERPTWKFAATTVTVPTCARCRQNVGPKSIVMKVTGMQSLHTQDVDQCDDWDSLEESYWQHRDGLVKLG